MNITSQNMLDHAHELCEDEDYVNALEYFDIVLEMEPNNLNAVIDKGVTFQNLEYFTKALQMYDKALLIEPENSDALINKGSILHILKKYTEAVFCYDNVIRHDKKNAMALAYKGLSIGEMGNVSLAITYFKKALSIEQNYDLAQSSLLTAKNLLKSHSK